VGPSAKRLLALINDILDLSKIESGKLQLNAHPFDLRETVAMVERVMKAIAAQSGITIVTKVDPALSEVVLDDVSKIGEGSTFTTCVAGGLSGDARAKRCDEGGR